MARLSDCKETAHPLSSQRTLARLLSLEEASHLGQTGSDVVGELCSIYSDLVQYYDLKRDPIHAYFLEKIQVLSLMESNKNTLQKSKADGRWLSSQSKRC